MMDPELLAWAKETYHQQVQGIADDPSGVEPADIALLQRVGRTLGLDFWAVAALEATAYELDRLKRLFGKGGETT